MMAKTLEKRVVRGILFKGEMVRKILSDEKTQTRRAVNPQSMVGHVGGSVVDRCPYGAVGDRLWVRETWGLHYGVVYRATDTARPSGGWKPSIHMPRKFSRILLEITDVRVERLQKITHEDAVAEGIPNLPGAQAEYRILWDRINGKRKGLAWADNPWVWALAFRRMR